MNKKDNTYIGYLQNVVTNLPKTEEEKKEQKNMIYNENVIKGNSLKESIYQLAQDGLMI